MSTIQAGKHEVTVISAEIGESKTKGTPGVFFKFKADNGDEIEGQMWLTDTVGANGKSPFERGLETLRMTFGFNDDFTKIGDQIEGKRCSITVEDEADDKGRFWPRVKWINALRGPSSKPAGSSLLARLTKQAKGVAKPADMPKATPKPAPVVAPVDDETDPY